MAGSLTWSDVSARLGRNDLPYALAMAALAHDTLTDPAEVTRGITNAWCSAEWPAQAVDPDIWCSLFDIAQPDPLMYLHDDEWRDRAALPPQITLYRGAIEDHAIGMSWTDDLERATWFAHRFDTIGGDVGKVYQVTIDPEVVLARFPTRRGEAEWVLDPNLIEDYEVTELERVDA
jgi:hypothetical protein